MRRDPLASGIGRPRLACHIAPEAAPWFCLERLRRGAGEGVDFAAPAESELFVGCDAGQGTPRIGRRGGGRWTDLTPPAYFSDLAEAYWLALLRTLYDLEKTERILRDGLPRPRTMAATMLKGKRIAVVAPGPAAAAFAARAAAWGIQLVPAGECDVAVGPAGVAGAPASFKVIVPPYRPTVELREAASDALAAFVLNLA